MTEPAADPQAPPWWARPGKLVWFGLTGGLGCGLMLLASLGAALARALAELLGGPQGLALGFLEAKPKCWDVGARAEEMVRVTFYDGEVEIESLRPLKRRGS